MRTSTALPVRSQPLSLPAALQPCHAATLPCFRLGRCGWSLQCVFLPALQPCSPLPRDPTELEQAPAARTSGPWRDAARRPGPEQSSARLPTAFALLPGVYLSPPRPPRQPRVPASGEASESLPPPPVPIRAAQHQPHTYDGPVPVTRPEHSPPAESGRGSERVAVHSTHHGVPASPHENPGHGRAPSAAPGQPSGREDAHERL
jgi:hypothetical protein